MRFFVGMHHSGDAGKVPAAFVSVNTLATRKSDFSVGEWIMDSGAFTTISKYGDYPDGVAVYAAQIRRWSKCGHLLAAVSQDYMCEPWMLAKTGLSIVDHQRLTIERFDELLACDLAGVYLMPVLQGYAPEDYVAHVTAYGARLSHGAWVGVGSVCKRNGSPRAIEAVLRAILGIRPDLRLHGFGVKASSLGYGAVRDRLFSADSMAWSFAARMSGRGGNDWRDADRFHRRISNMPVQLDLF
jgi:hypothetical protein